MDRTALVGFDWQLVHSVMGPPEREQVRDELLDKQSDKCFRALITSDVVGPSLTKVNLLVISGTEEAYALNIRDGRTHWANPDPHVIEHLRGLRRWG